MLELEPAGPENVSWVLGAKEDVICGRRGRIRQVAEVRRRKGIDCIERLKLMGSWTYFSLSKG